VIEVDDEVYAELQAHRDAFSRATGCTVSLSEALAHLLDHFIAGTTGSADRGNGRQTPTPGPEKSGGHTDATDKDDRRRGLARGDGRTR